MSDTPQGPDWWQASDDKWYPPPRPEMPGQAPAGPPGVAPAGPPVGPPAGPLGPSPVGGFPPGAQPSPYGGMPAGPQPPGQQNRTPLYIAIGVVVAAALIGLIVVLTSGDDDEPTASPTSETTDGPATTTGAPDTTGSPDTTGTAPTGNGTVEVVDSGFSPFMGGIDGNERTAAYGFIVENTGDELVTDIQINVSAFAADGTALANASHTVNVLRPGQRMGLGDEFYGENFASDVADVQIQVGEPSNYSAENVPDEGELTAEGINSSTTEYGIETTFTATSTYSQQVDSPVVYAVYRDAEGKIIGGSYSYLDFIPAGGSVAGTVESYEVIPNVADTEIYLDTGYW
jgi:hypothetical protein